MGFFSKLFGGDSSTQVSKISHPNQLKQGDVVNFCDSFALPELIRKQSYQVAKVNTYQFEHQVINEFVLQGGHHQQVFMSIESDDEEWLNLSIKLKRSQVGQLFDLEQFAEIFEEESQPELALQVEEPELNNWLAPVYFRQNYAQRGYFYDQDFRPNKPSLEEDDGSEPFDYFSLSNADESHSVEIEVWQDGDTDVLLSIHRPLTDIVDMYPGASRDQ
ncbi:hypothetical protein DS2_06071 [Catenovulum agarivorans DS-2]|uniref:DUF4178 domain-containing protein n=1 Tax=Catenovulum agarivorans DS-2 TaxID=1328313 RepID=W7QD60_9ALTE|nr:hypothetical protein [Catenovulum agarivorans]EWH10834.1 hypothetical protein DS2_06071 [Catenovulum agarivorans DS-2]